MADVIKLNKPMAQEMAQSFDQGAEHLQDIMQEMHSIANTMEEGALLGRTGAAFTEALRDTLCGRISRLVDKFNEMAGDVRKAIELMEKAEQENKDRF